MKLVIRIFFEHHFWASCTSVQKPTETDMTGEEYQERLHHQRIHHKAEISVIEDTYARTKSTMLTHVQHAQHALGKDKLNVVAYKLDVLAEMLGGE